MSGLMAIFGKELADHFNSKRFIILSILVYLASIFTVYVAAQNIRSGITETTQFIFLRFFTISGENQIFTFLFFLSFFIPIVGIALGFDAINGERASGNLSRLISQPLYRDSVINGKFLAGLVTLAILVTSLVLLVAGIGLRIIGVPPNAEEILRLVAFIIVSIIYGAFWMSLSVLFSVLLNRIATAALASIALWIFLTLFVPIIAQVVSGANVEIAGAINHISPGVLYSEVTQVLLIPSHPMMFMVSMYYTGLEPNPLPLSQSLLLAWPQLTSLIGLTALCFAISYIKFMREEIRST
jgi:ABC-2 type transport system permease protein